MDVKAMRAQVKEELKHIPKHPKPLQSELRMIYQTNRMRSLGKKADKKLTADEVLNEAIKTVRNQINNQDASFEYDKEFFAGN